MKSAAPTECNGAVRKFGRLIVLLAAMAASASLHASPKLAVLYNPPLQDGPIVGGMTLDGDALIGAVAYDGCCGALFTYNTTLNQFSIAHVFTGAADGAGPNPVLVDKSGTIFGTTGAGGTQNWGTVFSIGSGGTFQKLYDFTNTTDGAGPTGGLTAGRKSLLYGVTTATGPGNGGTIFSFNPATKTLTTLYRFTGGADGGMPTGDLLLDQHGDLLGTTSLGGDLSACDQGCGTVFRFNLASAQLTVLHAFSNASDGAVPLAGLTAGQGGVVYGTTSRLGKSNGGIFALDTRSDAFTNLYVFSAKRQTGHVSASLVLGSDGALYGAAPWGGLHSEGEEFRVDPATSAYRTLFAFAGETNGAEPAVAPIFGAGNVLYGATYTYGANDQGTLFKLTFQPHALRPQRRR
jgi:uncharacterized repeat protein (TIGR03803 family)